MPESRSVAPPARQGRRRLIAAAIAVLAVLALAWWLWPKDTGGQQGRPGGRGAMRGGPASMMNMAVPVRVGEARTQDIQIVLRALGTATAYNTVTVRSRVDGELVKVAFQEGQHVKAGDLLAQVDPRPFEVALAQAQGQQQ